MPKSVTGIGDRPGVRSAVWRRHVSGAALNCVHTHTLGVFGTWFPWCLWEGTWQAGDRGGKETASPLLCLRFLPGARIAHFRNILVCKQRAEGDFQRPWGQSRC